VHYNLSRLDSDPTYAPGISRAKQFFYWRPSAAFVKQGYSDQGYRLPGQAGDGLDLDRAAKCRELTRKMLLWASGNDRPKVEPGTWLWLIGRYKTDEFSPFQEVKANTRETYLFSLARWETAIGGTMIRSTDLPAIKRWQKAMQDNGRSLAYIKRMFTMLRIITGYGVQIKAPGARDVRDIFGEMRIKAPKPRSIAASEAQIMAVVAKADAAGYRAFSTGILFQWWLTLRAVDVRGQWLGMGAQKRWADGLTWDMLDSDLTTLRKAASKTEGTSGEVMLFDLTLLPDLRARLQAIPQDQRVGPVIKDATGKPFDQRQWPKLWRRFANRAGVPADVWLMDIRAGAINDAKRAGASQEDRQRQAGHASPEMTERYTREHDAVRNKVIQIRRGK
jgi:integrase